MEIKKYIYKSFKMSFNWSGRASRKEFWYFVLFYLIFSYSMEFLIIYLNLDYNIKRFFSGLLTLISFPAYLSVGYRRMKDVGYNGIIFFMPFICIICIIIMFAIFDLIYIINEFKYTTILFILLIFIVQLIFAALPGDKEANKYGEVPVDI